MTLACGRLGSDATLLSGGGKRAPSAVAPAPPDVERERMRTELGGDSRGWKQTLNILLKLISLLICIIKQKITLSACYLFYVTTAESILMNLGKDVVGTQKKDIG